MRKNLPKNSTNIIQIIGRALLLYPSKTIANIILPFSSKEDDKNICNFLKVIAKNDSRIKKSYENKLIRAHREVRLKEIAEESLRLLYVGMTRAEDELYISGFGNSTDPDSWYGILSTLIPLEETNL